MFLVPIRTAPKASPVQGEVGEIYDFARRGCKKDNPSVKNQRFLPAPFTQGSLGALPRQCDKLKFEHQIAKPPEDFFFRRLYHFL